MSLKRYVCLVIMFYCTGVVNAQYITTIEITDLQDANLAARVNENISTLLTELNAAQTEQRILDLNKLALTEKAGEALSVLWEVCPFRCAETEIIERGLRTSTGYQVRNIPVMMEPLKGESFDDDKYQEIVVNFNNSGQITNICFTISPLQYAKVMRSSNPVDLYRRQIVLDFIENFRTAYNRKDLPYLEKVYSDNALIITGNVVMVDNNIVVTYTSQDKQTYLKNLKRAFERNQRINIDFEDVKVVKHNTKEHIYGVTLKQYWNSSGYSDIGYLFLYINFKNEKEPQIYVRTWQPDDPSKPLPKSEIFSLSDFKIDD